LSRNKPGQTSSWNGQWKRSGKCCSKLFNDINSIKWYNTK
jgi:hypothetical protein